MESFILTNAFSAASISDINLLAPWPTAHSSPSIVTLEIKEVDWPSPTWEITLYSGNCPNLDWTISWSFVLGSFKLPLVASSISYLSSSSFQKLIDGFRVYKIYMGYGWFKSLLHLVNLSINFVIKYNKI